MNKYQVGEEVYLGGLMWNVIDENDPTSLPQVDFGYFLVTLQYYDGTGVRTVDKSFYTKDRELAKKHHGAYSRKHQGKQSVHFEKSGTCFRVLAWMEIPKPFEENQMNIRNLQVGDTVVAKNLMMAGKDWEDLERASAGALYTMLMLFLFSVLLAIPIAGMVKMYLLLDYVVGG